MATNETALKEKLQGAIDVFAQQVSAAFNIDDALNVTWRNGEESFPIARLIKGENFYEPKIELLHPAMLDEAQNKAVQQRLDGWLREHLDKTLASVLALEDAELKDNQKAIATRLFAEGGLIARDNVKDELTKLEKEDRQVLNKLGVRIGAFYIYQRDTLKPSSMRVKAALWRLNHDKRNTKMPLPQEGNVSMSAPEGADTEFYRAMAMPVFGKTCVRVDMVERLNSAIFDGAVNGKYAFDPALASTICVSVEIVQSILQELGFPFEDITTGENDEAKTVRHYSLKRHKPKAKETFERAPKRPEFKKTVEKKRHARKPEQKPVEPKSKMVTGYNAFAGLAALRDKQ